MKRARKWIAKISAFRLWPACTESKAKKLRKREIVHHRGIFYYKRQSQKCIKLEIDVFQASTRLHSVNNSVISSHCISRFCYCRTARTWNGKQKNPRRGITFEESFLRNRGGKKKGASVAKRFRNSSPLFIPERPQTASMIAIGRLPIPLSTMHLACRRPRLVRQSTITSRTQRRHAVAKGGR